MLSCIHQPYVLVYILCRMFPYCFLPYVFYVSWTTFVSHVLSVLLVLLVLQCPQISSSQPCVPCSYNCSYIPDSTSISSFMFPCFYALPCSCVMYASRHTTSHLTRVRSLFFFSCSRCLFDKGKKKQKKKTWTWNHPSVSLQNPMPYTSHPCFFVSCFFPSNGLYNGWLQMKWAV